MIDYYFPLQGHYTLISKGKTYHGFQLISPKETITFYTESKQEKDKWCRALNSLIKYTSINEFYELKKVIGKGSFGIVRAAVYKPTNTLVAIKGFVKANLSEDELQMVRREIDILRICNHPNVIKLYDYFEDENYIFISKDVISI